jgi:hypothetical protein
MGGVGGDVGRSFAKSVRSEAVGDAAGGDAGVASGEHVDGGVSDHESVSGLGVGLAKNGLDAHGVGLLGVEAVAAVNANEKISEPEFPDDGARGIDGLIREHGHFPLSAIRLNVLERRANAIVDGGVIEFVGTVVSEEVVERLVEEVLVVGIAERATYEHGCTVSDVGSDDVAGEFGAMEVAESCVDGVNEVETGVDEGAIEIEDDELDGTRIEAAVPAEHGVRIQWLAGSD